MALNLVSDFSNFFYGSSSFHSIVGLKGVFDIQFKTGCLIDYCYLNLFDDMIEFVADFKKLEKKKRSGFVFDRYWECKERVFARLKNKQHIFPKISLTLTDFVVKGKIMQKVERKVVAR